VNWGEIDGQHVFDTSMELHFRLTRVQNFDGLGNFPGEGATGFVMNETPAILKFQLSNWANNRRSQVCCQIN